jgi:hypothetical protein
MLDLRDEDLKQHLYLQGNPQASQDGLLLTTAW